MLALLDKDGKILDCNEHCSKNLGYEKNEMIGLIGPVDMVAEYDRQKAVDAFGIVVKNGINHDVPFDMMRKDHSIFPTIWSGAVLYDKSGNLEGYLVTGKDLSNLKNLENELEISQDHLKVSRLTTLGELTARLTHDMKNPLSSIFNRIDLIKMTTKEEKTIDHCNKIKHSLDQILHLIDDVTNFVRINPTKFQKNHLQDIIKNALEFIIIPNGIIIELPKDDPEINCDESQMTIVFTNLIYNAIQKLQDEGSISIQYDSDVSSHIIKIIDSGNPIPDDILDKIFEPLFTTKQKGTGLGLVSCKAIVEIHSGKLYVKNNPVTFTIVLPKNLK
ncbi:Signal transduction histidine kinase [Candidatus Nitrosarchaeum limnium SFB1]|jgi:PAS domain S-box-containing protein|uniref:Signal transduction histidine kinase n=1 Tax=Candidatus Nitrosarchaeum limnium SFB1 TaxID=886738 RepID=F3KI36_9ARCH|nr:Signal transduction histidine kinase [Candidatus Nitrosarchaeum limnium SFB1]